MVSLSASRRLGALRTATLLASVALAPAVAQQPRALTTSDYDRAAHLLGPWVNPLVVGGNVAATWLPDDRFYYKRTTAAGVEWVIVDPAKRTRPARSGSSARRGESSGRCFTMKRGVAT